MTIEERYKVLRETHQKMLLTKRETAKELSTSEASIDRLRASGELQSKKILGKIMFSLDEIVRYLSE